jgi:FkbM family methyltransferase
VFAFEPFPANFRNCAHNLRLNRVTNVVLSPKAIANDGRLLNMATDPHNSGGASAIVRTFASNGTVSDIASMTLDEVFSIHEIGRCKPLKIDCEGMEYEILLGARVLDKVEYLAGEFHASAYLQNRGWCPERLYAYCSSFFEDNKMTIQFNEIPE